MATVRKRNDKWQVQIRLTGIRPRTASFATKSKAMAWAVTEEKRLLGGETTDTRYDARKLQGYTMGGLATEWFELEGGGRKNRSGYASLMNDPLKDVYLADVTPLEVAKWRGRLLERLKPGSVRDYARTLSSAWEYGRKTLRLPLATTNPFYSLKLSRKHSRRVRRLYPGEYERLMANCVPENIVGRLSSHTVLNMPDMIDWAIETAMRRGELQRVRTEHITPCMRFITIPKTKTATPRKIPLTKKAQEIARKRILQGFTVDLFPYSLTAITNQFQGVCRAAGITDLRFHDLRHEALSRLNEKGMQIFDMQRVSGHASIKCLEVYVHSELERVALIMGA